MIKELSIQNFQSHADTKLEFDKGVNVIVGSSDSGKTAILRALFWVLENRPTGVGFISNFASKKEVCKVTAQLSEGGSISRIRGESDNKYVVNGTSLEAVGTSVPEEVTKAFNMTDVNISRQMDAPFLVSSTSGEVARFLNKTIKLDLIDTILASTESNKRKAKQETIRLEKEIEDVEDSITKLSWVHEAKKLATKIDIIEGRIDKSTRTITELSEQVENYKTYYRIIDDTSSIIPKAEILISSIKELNSKIQKDTATHDMIGSILDKDILYSDILKSIPDITQAEEKIKRIRELLVKAKEKNDTMNTINDAVIDLDALANNITTYDLAISDLKKRMPNVCPYCKGVLK